MNKSMVKNHTPSFLLYSRLLIDPLLLINIFRFVVTMQGQKEAPPDMQCKDKFLLQSVVANPGATTRDITPEMVTIQKITNFFVR